MSFDPKSPVAISPDGLTLAFVAIRSTGVEDAVRGGIWLRDLDQAQARLLPGTEGAEYPFWSPDSRWLGFYADGKLYKIDTRGGLAVALCEARDGRGGAWNKDGVILFQQRYSQALSRISAGGGTPTLVTQLDPSRFDVAHRWPRFLPGGKKFLFYVVSTTNPTSSEHSGIYVGSLDSDETTLIVHGESRGAYAAGHMVYRRASALMARPFDVDTLQFTGDELPLAGDIPGGAISWGGAYFGVAGKDLLLYLNGADATNTDLTWYDRSGNKTGTLGPSAGQLDVRLSHDGTRAVVAVGREAGDLWIHDLTRDVRTRFTFDPADDGQAQWSPDDRFIIFKSSRKSNGELYIRDTSGGSDEELLVETNQHVTLTDWSRDGRHIFYSSLSPETDWDLWVYSMEDKEARPLLVKEYDQNLARLSPNGRWVAYSSNESGRTEIYVQAFPDPGGRWMVSSGGGDDPIWSADGEELFFLTYDNMLMAVKVGIEPGFTVDMPAHLFPVNVRGTAGGSYDVSADGRRFLVNNLVKPTTSSLGVTVVTNWTGILDP
jgi:Tol biopolymer transport system component